MLEGVSKLGCHCDWCNEAVVKLVNRHVEARLVQQTVGVVEDDFADGHAYEEVADYFKSPGQRGVDAIGRSFSEVGDSGEETDVEECGHDLVAQNDVEAVPELWGVGLGGGLDFMTVREGGKEDINGLVEGAGDPEKGELDEERATDLEGLRGVGLYCGLPCWLEVKVREFRHCR